VVKSGIQRQRFLAALVPIADELAADSAAKIPKQHRHDASQEALVRAADELSTWEALTRAVVEWEDAPPRFLLDAMRDAIEAFRGRSRRAAKHRSAPHEEPSDDARMAALMDRLRDFTSQLRDRTEGLDEREREAVLRALLGQTKPEIAATTGLSLRTLERVLAGVFGR
jgi:hypothetical protein